MITNDQLVAGSPLGGNIDIDKYQSVIDETKKFLIEPVLGTKLFNKIQADYDAGTITGIYQTILEDYIQPIIIKNTAAEYIIISGFEIANGGAFRRTPEGAQPMTKSEIDFLANKQRMASDVYLQRLEKFLCDQRANIPEYTSAQDNNYDVKPKRDVKTTSGWRLGNTYFGHTSALQEIYKDIMFDET